MGWPQLQGQQLILSRETGSTRSEQGGGGQKVVTPEVKEQTSQRGTSPKKKLRPHWGTQTEVGKINQSDIVPQSRSLPRCLL